MRMIFNKDNDWLERKERREKISAESEGCGNSKQYGDEEFLKSKFLAQITEYSVNSDLKGRFKKSILQLLFEMTAKHPHKKK